MANGSHVLNFPIILLLLCLTYGMALGQQQPKISGVESNSTTLHNVTLVPTSSNEQFIPLGMQTPQPAANGSVDVVSTDGAAVGTANKTTQQDTMQTTPSTTPSNATKTVTMTPSPPIKIPESTSTVIIKPSPTSTAVPTTTTSAAASTTTYSTTTSPPPTTPTNMPLSTTTSLSRMSPSSESTTTSSTTSILATSSTMKTTVEVVTFTPVPTVDVEQPKADSSNTTANKTSMVDPTVVSPPSGVQQNNATNTSTITMPPGMITGTSAVNETTAPRIAPKTPTPAFTTERATLMTENTTMPMLRTTIRPKQPPPSILKTTIGPHSKTTVTVAPPLRTTHYAGVVTTGSVRTTTVPPHIAGGRLTTTIMPASTTSTHDGGAAVAVTSRAPVQQRTTPHAQKTTPRMMTSPIVVISTTRRSQDRTTMHVQQTTPHGMLTTGTDLTTRGPLRTTAGPVRTTQRRPMTTMVPSTTAQRHTPIIKTTTEFIPKSTTTETPVNVRYKLRFEGDCRSVLDQPNIRWKFEQNLKNMLVIELKIPKDEIHLQDISCGSVDVTVDLNGVQRSKVEAALDGLIITRVPVTVQTDDKVLSFRALEYAELEYPIWRDPEAVKPTTAPASKLRSVDLIIIIIVSIIGGVLIIIIIALIVHECRRRSHTKSFDLRGTPRPQLHTEDFTLTKMERGPVEYNDYGLVINSTANGHTPETKTPEVGVATIVKMPSNGDVNIGNGYNHKVNEKDVFDVDAGPDSPSISLMKSIRNEGTIHGIENPSFSSEDMLDSGTETDKEMVSSDKGLDSPDHVPLVVAPPEVAESDSGHQSDSPTDLPSIPDHTPPQHSPHSGQSDNHPTAEASIVEIEAPFSFAEELPPQSPSHEDVLMPSEETSYPNFGEAEEAPPPPVPSSPPPTEELLSHSPEQGLFEMTETRTGKRESDFFAPSEGATAF